MKLLHDLHQGLVPFIRGHSWLLWLTKFLFNQHFDILADRQTLNPGRTFQPLFHAGA